MVSSSSSPAESAVSSCSSSSSLWDSNSMHYSSNSATATAINPSSRLKNTAGTRNYGGSLADSGEG
ncbi:hypothetical protein HanIR_Chr05g0235171 [Helianthus annuus]|nr:hypothetical protein HanIR_Chr05g0235171 [Helianthus annuus]